MVPSWWNDPTFIPKGSGLAVLPGSGCHFPWMFPHPDSAVKDLGRLQEWDTLPPTLQAFQPYMYPNL